MPLLVLLLGLLGALLVDEGLLGLAQLRPLLVAQRQRVVRLVPLTERRRVDHHDGVLHDRLGAHQLVVARVVHDVDDPAVQVQFISLKNKLRQKVPPLNESVRSRN